jgi:hypothetical protein
MNFGLLPNLLPKRQQPASLHQLQHFSISFGALASASIPQYFGISILASEFPFAKGRNIPLCKVTTFFRLSRPLTYIYASPASISTLNPHPETTIKLDGLTLLSFNIAKWNKLHTSHIKIKFYG